MKLKRYLIAGAIVSLIGISMMLVGFASVGFNPDKLRYQGYEMKALEISDFDSVEIDVSNVEVVIEQGQKPLVVYYENKYDTYRVDTNDRVLKIEKISANRPALLRPMEEPSVSLILPYDFDGELDIETLNGQVTINSVKLGALKCKVINGLLAIDGLTADDVELNTTNGFANLVDCVADRIDIESSSTSTSIVHATINEECRVENLSGYLHLQEIASKGNIEVDCWHGSIHFYSLDAPYFRASTQNGDIRGNFDGHASEYRWTLNRANGDHNLPESQNDNPTADKEFFFEVANGDIDVEFDADYDSDETYYG